MKEIFLQISNRQDLSQDQVQAVFDRILKNEVSESQIAAFLMLNGHDFLVISCDSCHIKALWHLVNDDGMVTHDWDIIVDILENR